MWAFDSPPDSDSDSDVVIMSPPPRVYTTRPALAAYMVRQGASSSASRRATRRLPSDGLVVRYAHDESLARMTPEVSSPAAMRVPSPAPGGARSARRSGSSTFDPSGSSCVILSTPSVRRSARTVTQLAPAPTTAPDYDEADDEGVSVELGLMEERTEEIVRALEDLEERIRAIHIVSMSRRLTTEEAAHLAGLEDESDALMGALTALENRIRDYRQRRSHMFARYM